MNIGDRKKKALGKKGYKHMACIVEKEGKACVVSFMGRVTWLDRETMNKYMGRTGE